MTIEECIRTRRSVRKFTGDPVPDEDIQAMLDIAVHAPSGSNRQPWRFIVVRDQGLKAKMAKAIEDLVEGVESPPDDPGMQETLRKGLPFYTFFREAPAVIAVALAPSSSLSQRLRDLKGYPQWPLPIADLFSVGAAVQSLLLAIHRMGYGACWMTGPLVAQRELEEILEIHEPARLVSLIPVGRPAEEPGAKARLKDVVTWR